jgi:hypothetical protein
VNNDPVNYVDLWGLSATDSKNLNIQAGMQVGPVQQKVELNLQANEDKVSVDYSLTHKNPIFEVDIDVKITVPNPVGTKDTSKQVLQTGENTLKSSTANQLNKNLEMNEPSREWGRALERLKGEEGIPNDSHNKIMGNGDYQVNGEIVGNIADYLR